MRGLDPILPGVVNDARGTFVKLSAVKAEITKGHFERISRGLEEPFRLNTLDFET